MRHNTTITINKSSHRPHTGSVWIWSPNPDYLKKFSGDFLVQGYNSDKIFVKI